MRTTQCMKRIYGGIILAGMVFLFAACNTVTSSFSYSSPVSVTETGVFHANAISYADAWYKAVENGKSAGFTTIVSETTEQNSLLNEVVVTLIMTRTNTADTVDTADEL